MGVGDTRPLVRPSKRASAATGKARGEKVGKNKKSEGYSLGRDQVTATKKSLTGKEIEGRGNAKRNSESGPMPVLRVAKRESTEKKMGAPARTGRWGPKKAKIQSDQTKLNFRTGKKKAPGRKKNNRRRNILKKIEWELPSLGEWGGKTHDVTRVPNADSRKWEKMKKP